MLDAISFGSLFLILIIIVAGSGTGPPRGLMVRLLIPRPCPQEDEPGPSPRYVVIHVLSSGDVTINEDRIERGLLGKELHAIFSARNQRIVFFMADANLSVQEVAEVMDIAQAETDNVVLLTPGAEQDRESGLCLYTLNGAIHLANVRLEDVVASGPRSDRQAHSSRSSPGRNRP